MFDSKQWSPRGNCSRYHLIEAYMKFSLMKDKMQRNRLRPSEIPEEGRQGAQAWASLTKRGSHTQHYSKLISESGKVRI